MKFKSRIQMRIIGIVFLVVAVILPWIELFMLLQANLIEMDGLWCLVLLVTVVTTACWLLIYYNFWEKWFAIIEVTDNSIIWSCPLKHSHTLLLFECKFFGVQLEESYNGLPYPFIYISKHPYPRELEGKINKIRCSNEFVKFWYSDDLCNCLIAKFSNNRTGPLQYYQYQSQRNK